MRVTAMIILAATFLAGNSMTHAQAFGAQASASGDSSATGRAGKDSAELSSGTTVNAALSQPLDSKKNKPGDAVTAKTSEATKSGGRVVIPKGSKLVGHVTEAKARSEAESESSLGVVFDKAILKDGQEIPLNVTVRALAAAHAATASSLADDDFSSGRVPAGRTSGGAPLGRVTSSTGATTAAVGNTATNAAGGAVGSAVNSTGSVAAATKAAPNGLNAAGHVTSNSQGVFGLDGINLNSSNGAGCSLITSAGKNVHLDSGTQFLLVASENAATSGTKP